MKTYSKTKIAGGKPGYSCSTSFVRTKKLSKQSRKLRVEKMRARLESGKDIWL